MLKSLPMNRRVVTIFRVFFACLPVIVLASCGQDSSSSAPPPLKMPARTNISSGTVTAGAPGNPIPPKDAQWTIYCIPISGINHVAQATQIKQDLLKLAPNLPDWYVIHGETESVLYYGFYR